jgi:DNA-binding response OmpR family regulator
MEAPPPVVLVVDDDPALCAMLRRLLEQAGYVVETAPDGSAGRARLEHGGIDLLLLDLVLPDLSGQTLCRWARAREDDVHLPIIMLTELGDVAERHASFVAGADDYVTKPFNTTDLLDRVHAWVQTRQRAKATHARLQCEAILAAAHALRQELIPPLMLLLDVLNHQVDPDQPDGQTLLQEATGGLAAQIRQLHRLERYYGERMNA